MELIECPECMGAARRMPILSSVNSTDDYFQCEDCRQVLLSPKDESRPPVSFLFALRRQHAART